MAKSTSDVNRDDEVSTEKKLDDLYKLIDGIDIAMLTTRRRDGHLVSRAMQTQKRTTGTDLWFVTNWFDDKLDEIALDPHVNVSYYKDRTREWVSVSGTAIITKDKDLIRGLYKPDWKAWFANEGGDKDGSPDDPRITLILVEAHSVTYSKKDKIAPLVLFELAKAMVTGSPPKVADIRTLEPADLKSSAARDAR
jgi:general stress protein 26